MEAIVEVKDNAMNYGLKISLLILLFFTAPGCVHAQVGMPDEEISAAAPDSFLVAIETIQGRFEAKVYRSWGPLAADRFYHLVRLKYFDGVSIFRVVENYVAQFGIHNDAEVNRAWRKMGIEDEPVRHTNARGTIAFARGGPKTRTTQLFINLRNNASLDAMPVGGVVGYPPIAKIVSGMDEVVANFNAQYGNGPSMRQDSINVSGRAFLDRAFPGLDYIETVRVVEEY